MQEIIEDFQLDDDDSRVSRPSKKIPREIPQYKEQPQKTYKVVL